MYMCVCIYIDSDILTLLTFLKHKILNILICFYEKFHGYIRYKTISYHHHQIVFLEHIWRISLNILYILNLYQVCIN